ncbi:arabinose operon transcriptional regulator AraC [Tropicimonas isoalkanivorans]|uniref:AraC family transcriptional regulator, arabinose operon regulatory protein n=1 Tax=Tropicimonas isoalkanivorans TaxID=441112 RepID=A0A1I1DG84_9RHOB|nr:arabinose operon transcriptional regulator AraC [Tropicimonas isoalkanivorans]SFB73847.1 AraC family transcriptional regulator, arabinose operon regulatory protein [Tropicimonas isoalkanivorans]
MDDRSAFDPSQDPEIHRVSRKLSLATGMVLDDEQMAPLFPGYSFDLRLVAGITPIEEGGRLDFFIDRPNGMRGWIVNLTIEGTGQVFDGDQRFDVTAGDVLLFPPRVRHYYGRAPSAEKWWHRWIYFHPRAFWKPWLEWKRTVDGVYVLRHRDESTFSELFNLFVEVEKSANLEDALSTDLAFNRLEQILLTCARLDRPAKTGSVLVDERVLAACKLITENLDKPLGINEICKHVCLSPSRLSNLFRQSVGIGVIQWRDAQRVQYAMQILQNTNVPIKSLSPMVGYDDPLYFSRVFRKHTGMGPRAFRARWRDSSNSDAVAVSSALPRPAAPPLNDR